MTTEAEMEAESVFKMAVIDGKRRKVREDQQGRFFIVDAETEEETEISASDLSFEASRSNVMCGECGRWLTSEANVLRHQRAGFCNKAFCKADHKHILLQKVLYETIDLCM